MATLQERVEVLEQQYEDVHLKLDRLATRDHVDRQIEGLSKQLRGVENDLSKDIADLRADLGGKLDKLLAQNGIQ